MINLSAVMNIDEEAILKELLEAKEDSENVTNLKIYSEALGKSPKQDSDTALLRLKISNHLIQKLYHSTDAVFIDAVLSVLRFMSRDKDVVLKNMCSIAFLNLLLKYAKLISTENQLSPEIEQTELNSCRCLCNVIYLTRDSEHLCSNSSFLKGILCHIRNHKIKSQDQNVLNLKLLFLASALCNKGRAMLVGDYDARKIVLDFLKDELFSTETENLMCKTSSLLLSSQTTNMCCEILKLIFNFNMDLRRQAMYSQEERIDLDSTVELCSVILNSECSDSTLTESLHCNAGNALYSVPPDCLNIEKLIGNSSLPKEDIAAQSAPSYTFRNMKPVSVLLAILRQRIMNNALAIDVLHPLLALLSQLCRVSRDVRLYMKDEILPPRKDFKTRPEEGNELRHKLIKLFTHNNTDLKHGAADFLFVLCKEKVDRFVKYTGYGNAAGLLAMRGLLAGGRGETEYSDTDSDSDTEEYKEVCEEVNPVTGHVPTTRSNPMEGMSDEQKEYYAVQLANQLSKLSSNDIIQPMCVGEDGKLVTLQQKVHETRVESSDDDS